jgi:hypothetical protein
MPANVPRRNVHHSGVLPIVAELEGRIKQDLMGKLLVGRLLGPPDAPRPPLDPIDQRRTGPVELGENGGSADRHQLAPEPLDLDAKLHADLGVVRFIDGKGRLSLIQSDQGMLDALEQLLLVGDLPGLEAAHVVTEHLGEAGQNPPIDALQRPPLQSEKNDELEPREHKLRRRLQLLLQLLHRFEDMRGLGGDHVGGEEHSGVRANETPGPPQAFRSELDADEAAPRCGDDWLLPEPLDQTLKPVGSYFRHGQTASTARAAHLMAPALS